MGSEACRGEARNSLMLECGMVRGVGSRPCPDEGWWLFGCDGHGMGTGVHVPAGRQQVVADDALLLPCDKLGSAASLVETEMEYIRCVDLKSVSKAPALAKVPCRGAYFVI